MQVLELRVLAWTLSQNCEEYQLESSLSCISCKIKPQPFPLKFCFGENKILKNNSAPLVRQSRSHKSNETTCKHCDSCPNFSALKTRQENTPHNKNKKRSLSIKLLYASCLKSTRKSSPHELGCFFLSTQAKRICGPEIWTENIQLS